MPQNVGAAILAKVERVLAADAGDERFVAFHMPAIPYGDDELALVNTTDPARVRDSAAQQHTFARLTNLVPEDRALFGSDGAVLWDPYGTLVAAAMPARGRTDPAEAGRFDAARAVLFDADGQPSEAYIRYAELQREVVAAEEAVRNTELAIEASDDAAYREEMQGSLEATRAALASASQRWLVEGQRLVIEEALATLERAARSAPETLWRRRREAFDAGLRSDPDFGDYWRTGFEPANIVSRDEAWSRISIDPSEINGLVARARREVREAAESWAVGRSGSSTDVEIESLSMRAARVRLVRSWFDPEMFAMRDWRLPPHHEPASDGGRPVRGALPAVAVDLLLVKDIDIRLKAQSNTNTRFLADLKLGKINLIGPFAVRQPPGTGVTTPPRLMSRGLDLTRLSARGVDGDARLREAVNARRLSNATMIASTAPVSAGSTSSPTASIVARAPVTALRTARVRTVARPTLPLARVATARPPASITAISSIRLAATATSAAPAGDHDPTIYVVGFVCRRTPKAPDPDTTLDWGV